jgi:hypothetical protein
MGLAEAVSLEQKAHIEDLERQQKDLERRQRRGEILPGEVLSQKEKDARLKTFMYAISFSPITPTDSLTTRYLGHTNPQTRTSSMTMTKMRKETIGG